MSYDSSLICIDYDVCGIINGWSLNTTDITFLNSPYSVKTTDVIIFADATLGNIVINLSLCQCKTRPSFIIKKIDSSSNTVTIIPQVGSTIDFGANFILYRENETSWLVYDPPSNNWGKLSNLPEDILSVKGDLIGYDGNSAVRLPVGTDGQVLMADSAQPYGLIWSNTGGGGEVNTGANVGTGAGKPFQSKVGTTLEFRSIAAGRNIAVTNGATDITIDNIVSSELITTSVPTSPTVDYELTQISLNSTTLGGSVINVAFADGTILGQRKVFTVVTKTGDDMLRINFTTFLNGTGLQFDDLADTCELIWTINGWVIVSNSGATIIGGVIPAMNLYTYVLAAIPIAANTTGWSSVAYFPYSFAKYFTYKSGQVVFWLDYVDRALSIRIWNATTAASIGQLLGDVTNGIRTFNITVPLLDSKLELQVMKLSSGGNSPVISGVNLEFNS